MTMLSQILDKPATALTPDPAGSRIPAGAYRMYAIAFDMDTEMLEQHYGSDSYKNAYKDIRNVLTTRHNFTWQQGSVYFGDPNRVNAVTCVLAVIDLSRNFPWFS